MSVAVEMQRTAFEQTMTAVEQGVESQRAFAETVVNLAAPAVEEGSTAVEQAVDGVDLFTALAPEETAAMLEEFSAETDAWCPDGTAQADTAALGSAFETYSEEFAETVETHFEAFEAQAETLERQLDGLTTAATDTTETTDSPTEADEATADVETVSGIGPTYADRLAEQGIESVADLAAADVETVALAAEVAETRADEWITAARTQA
jgi:predicted flap endonuclease-1-like 5' DNA nuclease